MTTQKLTFWSAVKKLEELSDGKQINLENVKIPHILKDRLLMKEGTHNGVFYPGNELKEADIFNKRFSLFHDHEDSSDKWIGEIEPKTFDEESKEIRGDIIVIDKQMAMNLAYGAKLGLSPTIDVDKLERADGPPVALDPQFISWATVINPAVGREIMLNSKNSNSQSDLKMDEKQINDVATRVVEMLSQKDDKKKEQVVADKVITEKLEKAQADVKSATEELEKYQKEESNAQIAGIRIKEEFLSQKENEFSDSRIQELEKMGSEAREVLSGALDKFISDREALSKFTEFLSDYTAKNPTMNIADGAKAFRKQAALNQETEEEETETDEKKDEDLAKKDGVSSRQSLSFDGAGSGKKITKEQARHDANMKMHAHMLKAQGGN